MSTSIAAYTEDRVEAVRAFNRRVSGCSAYAELRLPETAIPEFPPVPGRRVYQEYFLAVENGDVRGGYILRHQDFSIRGCVVPAAHYRLPLSEGIVNNAYAGVAVQMLRSALGKQPVLFALGMGGRDKALPRMLTAAGWSTAAVPFYFLVLHPRVFLRNVQPLRTSPVQRVLLDAAASTGAGWVALKLLHGMRLRAQPGRFEFSIVNEFGSWADAIWERCAPRYALSAVRERAYLNLLYPRADKRFVRVRVNAAGADLGWAVLVDTLMRGHKQFGDLRVGTIVDAMAEPEHAPAVVAAATEMLRGRGVDLIVSNQSHRAWGEALGRAGYLRGPSNFVFAASPRMAKLIGPFDSSAAEIHINRGDGDGPVHL